METESFMEKRLAFHPGAEICSTFSLLKEASVGRPVGVSSPSSTGSRKRKDDRKWGVCLGEFLMTVS